MNATLNRRVFWLLAALASLTLSGCFGGTRLNGKWETTVNNTKISLEFTSTHLKGAFTGALNKKDLGWEPYEITTDKQKVIKFKNGPNNLSAKFTNDDKTMTITGNTMGDRTLVFTRVGGAAGGGGGSDVEGARPDKEYVLPYAIVVLAIALGMSVVCRPARREVEPKVPILED